MVQDRHWLCHACCVFLDSPAPWALCEQIAWVLRERNRLRDSPDAKQSIQPQKATHDQLQEQIVSVYGDMVLVQCAALRILSLPPK